MRGRPSTPAAVMLAVIALLAAVSIVALMDRSEGVPTFGVPADYRLGVPKELPWRATPDGGGWQLTQGDGLPLYLIRSARSIEVLLGRDPHLGCRVMLLGDERPEMQLHPLAVFLTPCHGEQYDAFGGWLAGPSPRGLDRFLTVLDAEGRIEVAVDFLRLGDPAD